MERIKNFFNDESGASAVEYGLLVTLIAVAIIGGARPWAAALATCLPTRQGTLWPQAVDICLAEDLWFLTPTIEGPAPASPGLISLNGIFHHRRDHPMKHEGSKDMVLQTMVALLSLGLAVTSFLLMGRWV